MFLIQDAVAQSCRNTEDRGIRVLGDPGRGDQGNRGAPDIDRQQVDNFRSPEEEEVLLHVREKASLLQNLHAEELRTGVRGEFHAEDLSLRSVLHAQ